MTLSIVTINVCTEKGIIAPRISCVSVDLPCYHLGRHYCNMIVIILNQDNFYILE